MSRDDVTAAALMGASLAPSARSEKPAAFGCVRDPRQLRIELSSGPFSLMFYEPMSLDDVDDIEATLAILIRSLKRRASLRDEVASEPPSSGAAATPNAPPSTEGK